MHNQNEIHKLNDQTDTFAWDLIIRPQNNLFDLKVQELWSSRDLLYMLVKRDIITTYKQTILGPVWFFIQPILTTLTFIVVFKNIANISTDGVPAVLFYLNGITIWNYFADSLNKTSTTFTTNANLFGKVYFPRLIVPLSVTLGNLVKFAIQFSLFFLVWFWYLTTSDMVHPNSGIVMSIYCLALMSGLGLGLGIIISALTTKYRDLTFLISFGVQLLMYTTPIIYPLSALGPKYRNIIWWNPLTHIVETFRFGFTGAGSCSLYGVTYASVVTIGVLIFGIILFNRTEKTVIDTV